MCGAALKPSMERLWSPGEADHGFAGLLPSSLCCRAGTACELCDAGCLEGHGLAVVMCMALCACNHCHTQQRSPSVLRKPAHFICIPMD